MNENRASLSEHLLLIAWGYFFLLLNINLGILDLLPNWLGMLLIYRALPELGKWQPSALLLRPLAILLGTYEAILWLFTFLEITNIPEPFVVIFAVLNLYFHFQLLTNLSDLARSQNCFQGNNLRIIRNIYALLCTVTALPIPWASLPLAPAILLCVTLVILISLLCNVSSLRKSITQVQEEP